jgi:hypothetical protein
MRSCLRPSQTAGLPIYVLFYSWHCGTGSHAGNSKQGVCVEETNPGTLRGLSYHPIQTLPVYTLLTRPNVHKLKALSRLCGLACLLRCSCKFSSFWQQPNKSIKVTCYHCCNYYSHNTKDNKSSVPWS